MSEIEFKIVIRAPIYPVIIVSADQLHSAFNINVLAEHCLNATPGDGEDFVKVIDSSGEEFWYSPSIFTIAPGFMSRKWTKKNIIEMYNESQGVNGTELEYPVKSLSSKKLDRIIFDISKRLKICVQSVAY
jgi:hypothetical protein